MEERRLITGDFESTLSECQTLLDQNKEFRQRRSNVLENLRWHLAQQDRRIDDLRSRISFHSEKIHMVIERLKLNILTDQDDKLNDILVLSEYNAEASDDLLLELRRFRAILFEYLAGRGTLDAPSPEDEHMIGSEISQRLERLLRVNAPDGIEHGIPIAPGFDALLTSWLGFQQCANDLGQIPETYVVFLRTRWILEHIIVSHEYIEARPGFYYKRAINRIAYATLARMRKPGALKRYPESLLMSLPDLYFQIWPEPITQAPVILTNPHALMLQTDEKNVANMQLAQNGRNPADELTILKSSEERFRLVVQRTHPSQPHMREIVAQTVLTNEDKLIPGFALPTALDPIHQLSVLSRGGETLYQFGSVKDMHHFQTLLTGYEVSHDQDDIACQFSRGAMSLDTDKGRIQLWQDPIGILTEIGGNTETQTFLSDNSHSSSGSDVRRDSVMAPLSRATTINVTKTGTAADPLKLSALVIFAPLKSKQNQFAIIFVELGPQIAIDATQCDCYKSYNTCSKLCLTRRDNTPLKFRVLRSSTYDSKDKANPCLLDLFRFRVPHHCKYKTLPAKKTKYLTLKFQNLSAKVLFNNELNDRFKVRKAQLLEQQGFAKKNLYLQDQPKILENFISHSSA